MTGKRRNTVGSAFAEAPQNGLGLPEPAHRPARGSHAPGSSFHTDHRKRLKDRFMTAGPGALADYEMLELVLFAAVPRRDVKPLAKQLIATFGDFNHVIAAPEDRLVEVPGVGPAVVHMFKIVEAAAHRFAQARVLRRDRIASWDMLVEYCRTAMAHREIETFRILFLDRKNALIADEEQGRGTVDHVPVYPREIARRALQLNASAIILVHNHPSGDPQPSGADIDMTAQIARALEPLGVTLHDHIVIGKGAEASFRAMGLL